MTEAKRPPLVLMIHGPGVIHASCSVYLAAAGFRVAHARSGAEGLAQATVLSPDLIVLDCESQRETVPVPVSITRSGVLDG